MLRRRPLGEADHILTLLSRERGKLSAVAKGVRKTQSKFGARLDFFNRAIVTLHSGRSLDIVTGASSVGGAWERIVDPDAFAFASYVAAAIDDLCESGMAVPELFDVVRETHDALASGTTPGAIAAAVDLHILAALGLAPSYPSAIPHPPCQGIAEDAYAQGELGIVPLSAVSPVDEELVIFDRDVAALAVKTTRVKFASWY